MLNWQVVATSGKQTLALGIEESGLTLEAEYVKEEEEEVTSLVCRDCDALFTSEHHLLNHLLHHIKQPFVSLSRVQVAPIKITLKSKDKNNFEVVQSPTFAGDVTAEEFFKLNETSLTKEELVPKTEATEEIEVEQALDQKGTQNCELFDKEAPDQADQDEKLGESEHQEGAQQVLEEEELYLEGGAPEESGEQDQIHFENGGNENEENDETNVTFSPNFAKSAEVSPSADEEESYSGKDPSDTDKIDNTGSNTPETIPGAEPTPPPEPTEYPKIRIKTTGLLKESLTITEITDEDNFRPAEIVDVSQDNQTGSEPWPTPSLEDPLRLPDGSEKDDGNLLTSFLNNSNEQAKDFGLSSSDSEFISLDRLDDRNRNALQVYNPSTSVQNSLESLTGLPMQQLAQQVSRLQPSGGSGMHQQNVLINIQQFPQAPPQPPPHGYQPPPMYPPHPGMHGQPPPMYQPYQYQPPNMYYPPQPSYPSHHMPPPPNQMQQPPTSQQMQPITSQTMHPPQQTQYRQPLPQRAPAPRQYPPQSPRTSINPRQPVATRQRAPSIRPRMPMPVNANTAVRGPRPRMQGPTPPVQRPNTAQNNQQGNRVIKRTPEQIQMLQSKKRRMDVLVPDKNDDPDCQVIAVQPKNTDGGLPQIQSVQGGTSDLSDNSVMHLSDSITLSVRNPPKQEQAPKKSDAKAVANILATRGITVTATPKPKEKQSPQKSPPPPPVAINLNSAVSIIPTAKNGNDTGKKPSETKLPTVDLTDDTAPEPKASISQAKPMPSQKSNQRATLPYRCDLCPAQYPTSMGLSKHRQSYHKTGGPCEIGVPLVDLKNPGVLQKLSSLGIYNYIPMPGSNSDNCFALPVVSLNAAKNPTVCNLNGLGASSILTLGPVRSLPKSNVNSTSTK